MASTRHGCQLLEGEPVKNIGRPFKWSGLLVTAGLSVQLFCLLCVHPLSFIAFLGIDCPLVGVGIGIYLGSLAWHSESQ